MYVSFIGELFCNNPFISWNYECVLKNFSSKKHNCTVPHVHIYIHTYIQGCSCCEVHELQKLSNIEGHLKTDENCPLSNSCRSIKSLPWDVCVWDSIIASVQSLLQLEVLSFLLLPFSFSNFNLSAQGKEGLCSNQIKFSCCKSEKHSALIPWHTECPLLPTECFHSLFNLNSILKNEVLARSSSASLQVKQSEIDDTTTKPKTKKHKECVITLSVSTRRRSCKVEIVHIIVRVCAPWIKSPS